MFEVKEFQLKRLSFDMALRDVQGLRHPWNQLVFEADPHLHHSIYIFIILSITIYHINIISVYVFIYNCTYISYIYSKYFYNVLYTMCAVNIWYAYTLILYLHIYFQYPLWNYFSSQIIYFILHVYLDRKNNILTYTSLLIDT